MSKIKNIEKLLEISNHWQPADLKIIKKIEWLENKLTIQFYCQIRKGIKDRPIFTNEYVQVSVVFTEVSSLKLDVGGTKFFQITGFDIVDISSNKWENINFQIEDYENGRIEFYCKEVIIDSVGMPEELDY